MCPKYSPCAACKCIQQKCTPNCVFAPYFPPDDPTKFTNVHKVFGASNVGKILSELPTDQRQDAVNFLAFEAEARLKDPMHRCDGDISTQFKLMQITTDLDNGGRELAYSVMLADVVRPEFLSGNQQWPQNAKQQQMLLLLQKQKEQEMQLKMQQQELQQMQQEIQQMQLKLQQLEQQRQLQQQEIQQMQLKQQQGEQQLQQQQREQLLRHLVDVSFE